MHCRSSGMSFVLGEPWKQQRSPVVRSARLPPGDSSSGRSGQDAQGLFYGRQMVLNVAQS